MKDELKILYIAILQWNEWLFLKLLSLSIHSLGGFVVGGGGILVLER